MNNFNIWITEIFLFFFWYKQVFDLFKYSLRWANNFIYCDAIVVLREYLIVR